MIKDNFLTCIIPFYNENPRIFSVVEAALKVKYISQVICVDDGSQDGAYEALKSAFPDVDVIRLEQNVGKAGAIFAALPYAKNEFILLLDGDLFGIQSEELENAYIKFFNNSLDMLILRAHGEEKYRFLDNTLRHYLVLSGNRFMKTSDLEAIRSSGAMGYQIEVAINQYMIKNDKKTGWTIFSALNLRKSVKHSFWDGWKRDIRMWMHIISYLGIWKMLKQFSLFCREEVV